MQISASTLFNRLLARGKLRHVQVLLELAERGSVQRAAEALNMTQSAVTQSLAYLERLLETPLFQRHARGVRPTPACTDLLPVARHILHGVAEVAETVTSRQREGLQSVRLLTSAAASTGLLVRALPAFHARHPLVQVHLREAEGQDLLLMVSRREADLVACRQPAVVPEGWQFRTLVEDCFVVVAGVAHPLARKRRVGWAELPRQTWLLPPVGTAARDRFDAWCVQFPSPPATYPLVTRQATTLVWMLRQQPLLCLLPLSVVAHLIDAGELALIAAPDVGTTEPLGLLLPLGPLPEAAAALAAFLMESDGRV